MISLQLYAAFGEPNWYTYQIDGAIWGQVVAYRRQGIYNLLDFRLYLLAISSVSLIHCLSVLDMLGSGYGESLRSPLRTWAHSRTMAWFLVSLVITCTIGGKYLNTRLKPTKECDVTSLWTIRGLKVLQKVV